MPPRRQSAWDRVSSMNLSCFEPSSRLNECRARQLYSRTYQGMPRPPPLLMATSYHVSPGLGLRNQAWTGTLVKVHSKAAITPAQIAILMPRSTANISRNSKKMVALAKNNPRLDVTVRTTSTYLFLLLFSKQLQGRFLQRLSQLTFTSLRSTQAGMSHWWRVMSSSNPSSSTT